MMKAIKEYIRTHHGVIQAPPAYVIRKNVIIKTYGDYTKYLMFDDKIIARMLNISQKEQAPFGA